MGLTLARSYEDLLADGLEACLGKGVDSVEGFVEGLNEANIHGPNGSKWTVELLAAELRRLGD